VWVGKDEDNHVPNHAAVVGNGERGGNAEVQIRGASSEEVVGFRTQPIQSNNVVKMNL